MTEPFDPINSKRHELLWAEMRLDKKRFNANDNVHEYLRGNDLQVLIDEATEAMDKFLRCLLIDVENDPNSKDTARRIAKMYFGEIMAGRYEPSPVPTGFPNEDEDDRYDGMVVMRAEIKSMCSHHHQPVTGTAFIGILPDETVLGLSKYPRIAQHLSRRGTLQEALCQGIRKEISKVAKTENVAVYIEAEHGCCTNRGIMAHSSLTQTMSLGGVFLTDIKNKEEFFHCISLQKA